MPHQFDEFLRAARPAALDVARAVALLDVDAELPDLAMVTGLDRDELTAAVDELVVAGLLCNQRPLRFTCSLLGDAVLANIPVGERISRHLRIAEHLRAVGADHERISAHLVAAGPVGEAWAPRVLTNAAHRAMWRGDPDAARRYLGHALSEPLTPEERLVVVTSLAELRAADDPRCAAQSLTSAMREATKPSLIASYAVAASTMHTQLGAYVEARDVVREARKRLGTSATELDQAAAACELYEHGGWRRLPRSLPVVAAVARLNTGAGRAEAVSGCRKLVSEVDISTFWHSAVTLSRSDEVDAVWGACETVDGRTPHVSWQDGLLDLIRADVRLREGRAADAVRICRGALEQLAVLRSGSEPPALTYGVALLVEALTLLGELDEASSVLVRHGYEDQLPAGYGVPDLQYARGVLLFAGEAHELALRDFLECGRRLTDGGVVNPAVLPWRSNAAQCLAVLGYPDRGVVLAEEDLAIAHRWDSPRPIGVALHALALCHSGGERLELLGAAHDQLLLARAPVERARVLIALAVECARVARFDRAREYVAEAGTLVETYGLVLVGRELERCVAEIGRLQRGALAPLTRQEREVADRAAAGATNREISRALRLSVRTVEYHLSSVYRKLGLSGRSELPAVLDAAG